MTKAELINVVAQKTELSKKDSEKAVVAVIDAISEALEAGEKIEIPSSKLPSFKAGKALKEIVSK